MSTFPNRKIRCRVHVVQQREVVMIRHYITRKQIVGFPKIAPTTAPRTRRVGAKTDQTILWQSASSAAAARSAEARLCNVNSDGIVYTPRRDTRSIGRNNARARDQYLTVCNDVFILLYANIGALTSDKVLTGGTGELSESRRPPPPMDTQAISALLAYWDEIRYLMKEDRTDGTGRGEWTTRTEHERRKLSLHVRILRVWYFTVQGGPFCTTDKYCAQFVPQNRVESVPDVAATHHVVITAVSISQPMLAVHRWL
ncbi:hypothetical protein EVAR_91860_1 [Eumeta japonica]|uniref:Uncharacterized protein n=1 Tax=Eumeta variegata TaxID=151549 RepID=A0A4C2AFE2_EUMVA|nr:hypothetical protein EVAR_91860_1 [Eumeta japonica]